MTQLITAVYEHGVLRPLKRLHLAENQTVQLQIVTEPNPDATQMALQSLIATGLLTPPLEPTAPSPYSPADRQQAADFLGHAAAIPLSQLIIEDRGDL